MILRTSNWVMNSSKNSFPMMTPIFFPVPNLQKSFVCYTAIASISLLMPRGT